MKKMTKDNNPLDMSDFPTFEKLTQRHQRFVKSFIQTDNITKSAIEAGYSPSSARNQGHRTHKREDVQEAIQEIRQSNTSLLVREAVASQDECREMLTEMLRANVSDFLKDGQIDMESQEAVSFLNSLKKVKFKKDGKGITPDEIELYDKIRAMEMLGKVSGWFDKADKGNTQAIQINLNMDGKSPQTLEVKTGES